MNIVVDSNIIFSALLKSPYVINQVVRPVERLTNVGYFGGDFRNTAQVFNASLIMQGEAHDSAYFC